MSRNVKLLLTENVDSLGIVGDVVNVRTGYARNFLLPRSLATQPSEEKVKELAGKRAEAQKQLAELRKSREALIGKIEGAEVKLIRSCNDQGHLYGSVTQQDIAEALTTMGFAVKPREVRIAQVMKRIDSYEVQVKLDSDLTAGVRVVVAPDRELDMEAVKAAQQAEQGAQKAPAAEAEPQAGEQDAQAPSAQAQPAKIEREKKKHAPAAEAEASAPAGESKGKKKAGGKGEKASEPAAEKKQASAWAVRTEDPAADLLKGLAKQRRRDRDRDER